MTVKLPWIKWRNGRPRLAHGPRERAMGFEDRDLRHPPIDETGRPTGRWFSFEEAKAVSDETIAKVTAARAAGRAIARPTTPPRATVADLLADWEVSDEFRALSSAARESYRKCISAILWRPQSRSEAAEFRAKVRASKVLGLDPPTREPEPMAGVPPTAIGKPELRDFFNYLVGARGHHMALAVISALSAALTWGSESSRWRLPANPRLTMEFARPEGRVVLVTMAEFSAWVAAADYVGRASIGDSFYLGLFTGQRQADRLVMADIGDDDRHAFRQRKTGELVDIKQAPQLTTRLEAARTRVAALKLGFGLRALPREIVINEMTGEAYDKTTYRHWVSVTRDVAVFGALARMSPADAQSRATALALELRKSLPTLFAPYALGDELDDTARERAIARRDRAVREFVDEISTRDSNADPTAFSLAPCPSLLFVNGRGDLDAKHDQDLRDTCVMLLDRAGCDLLTICDITGHSYKSAQTIVKHYRARNPDRADSGIDALVLQVRKEGLAG